MALFRGLVGVMLKCWNSLSGFLIDGVPWTSIIISFAVFLVVVNGLLHARR